MRGVGPTDLLLILFFEVDTGIMEVEVPGSLDLLGVWKAGAVDLGLTGEEGLDFACELAVGRAKPIDFRAFGVTGVDENAEGPQCAYQVRVQKLEANKRYLYLGPCHLYHPSQFPSSLSPSGRSLDLSSPSPSMRRPACSLQLMTW